jgi:hypothetical protein
MLPDVSNVSSIHIVYRLSISPSSSYTIQIYLVSSSYPYPVNGKQSSGMISVAATFSAFTSSESSATVNSTFLE